jgi:hypothetical protein
LRTEAAWRQVHGPDIGARRPLSSGPKGPFVVCSPRKAGKALLLEDLRDRYGAESIAGAGQLRADVIDGEVVLAQLDDPFAHLLLLRSDTGALLRRQEELPLRMLTKLVTENSEAAWGVAEAGRCIG